MFDETKLDRGTNESQMVRIAENCNLSEEKKKRFYDAVKKFEGRDWRGKGCFPASQQFLTDSILSDELEYREGYCTRMGIPIQHSWLSWGGQILDLTYGENGIVNEANYFPYFEGDNEESHRIVARNISANGRWDTIMYSPDMTDELADRMRKALNDASG